MADLIPLNIDRETGNIVARGGPASIDAEGYLYEQIIPAKTWNIPHNNSNDRVIVQIYNSTGNFSLPDEIIIVDINNIQILFNVPIAGTAHIVFFTSS
jgi:hypothetical protein